jgi:hypothetical protein
MSVTSPDPPVADRPISAFAFSLIGGIITLIVSLITINTWFNLYSTLGAGFAYSSLILGDIPSGEAIVFFIVGALCGISIVAGAVLQYSGKKSRVRTGSILALFALVIGIPTSFFGMVIGGILSVVGVALGLTWKPDPILAKGI